MKLKNIKSILSDESGFSLLELIIAVTLLIIISAAFATATVGSTATVRRNMVRQTIRSQDVGQIDQKISKTKTFKNGTGGDYDVSALGSPGRISIRTTTGSLGRTENAYVVQGDNHHGSYNAFVTVNNN